MAILLRESDVEKLATMKMAIEAVEQAFGFQAEQKADVVARRGCRLNLDGGMLYTMSASLPTLGYAGLKSYINVGGVRQSAVLLYKCDGRLAAIIEAETLGRMRTGAASAVATKYMARENSSLLGIFGTGLQARSQIGAIREVHLIKTVFAYSRDAAKREKFCKEMTEILGIDINPAATPEEAVKGMDIVVTATTSKEPVFKAEWLSKGTHINAVGADSKSKRELDAETVGKCACVVVDCHEQSMLESVDLAQAAEKEAFFWEDARELGMVVIGEFPGREDNNEITLFESQGIALEDVALAARIFDQAVQSGMGENLPL